MDFDLTEEQKMLQTTLQDFYEKEIAPAAFCGKGSLK